MSSSSAPPVRMFLSAGCAILVASTFCAVGVGGSRSWIGGRQVMDADLGDPQARQQALELARKMTGKSDVQEVLTEVSMLPRDGILGEPVDLPPDHVQQSHLPFDPNFGVDSEPRAHDLKDIIMDIGGGTGASVSGTGDTFMDRALLRRMRYQDKAVMLLLLLAYMGSLMFSASIAYRQARNSSPVTFYADPRFHSTTVDSEDVETFLEAFNQPAADAQLQVTGLVPLPPLPDYVVDAAVTWLGSRYMVAFSFALDLSPWLVPLGSSADGRNSDWSAGVAQEDVERLRTYLASDKNDLSFVEMQKEVEWKDWEELATNIKSKIRQGGFNGVISVQRKCEEVVGVHKNKQWANFMHSRTTKVLLALSVVGWFIYQPYIFLRHTAITVRCKYRVDIDIGQYWPLIAEKIGPEGFSSGVGTSYRATGRQGPRA